MCIPRTMCNRKIERRKEENYRSTAQQRRLTLLVVLIHMRDQNGGRGNPDRLGMRGGIHTKFMSMSGIC